MLRGTVPSVNSRAQHTFSRAPQASIPRSKFNRSHGIKTTFNEGYLIPILVDEMLPGDTFNCSLHAFARLNTPVVPIMDNMYLETFFFAVPYRLVWDNWEKFNGFQENPGDSTDYLIPQIVSPGVGSGSLADYMGLPIGDFDISVSALPFRAYDLIWNEWFRDENMQDSVIVPKGDGPDLGGPGSGGLKRRGKRHDYFTSCLPFPQKGPDVAIPLSGSAIVAYNQDSTGISNWIAPNGPDVTVPDATGFTTSSVYGQTQLTVGGTPTFANYNPSDSLLVNLSDVTNATINDLRLAFQTQKLYERDARGGTRYTEIIKSHFGVVSPDMRLQRPEYLGGGSTPILINPVAQTAPTDGDNPLGQLAAYGTCAPKGHGFIYSATEHCIIIGLVSVRADLNYQQGIERMWSRKTRLDFYWPALSHLGEQAVLNKEIYYQGTSADDDVFGYQERFAEYRYKPGLITGLFRSNAAGTQDFWHLAQDFGALPTLNNDFIVENAPMDRILAVDSQPNFLFDGFFRYICARPMPVYAVPGLVDHF